MEFKLKIFPATERLWTPPPCLSGSEEAHPWAPLNLPPFLPLLVFAFLSSIIKLQVCLFYQLARRESETLVRSGP